jgi:hypothetical protein
VARQLPANSSCPLPIELDADVEPGLQDDLGRQRAPRFAVELDLDPFPRP